MDIDTYIVPEMNKEGLIREILKECEWKIMGQFHLEIDAKGAKFSVSNPVLSRLLENPRINVHIPYFGPMYNPKHPPAKIKLTLDSNDTPVLPTTREIIYHPFSDRNEHDLIGNSISYPELFAQKLFALQNRKLAKDLYDIAIMTTKYDILAQIPYIKDIVKQKMRSHHKNVPLRTLDGLYPVLRANWEIEIPKKVAKPIDFDDAFELLKTIYKRYNGGHRRIIVKQRELAYA
jgi:hypothetical protein